MLACLDDASKNAAWQEIEQELRNVCSRPDDPERIIGKQETMRLLSQNRLRADNPVA